MDLQPTDTVTGFGTGPFVDIIEATASGTVLAPQFVGVTNIEGLALDAGGNITLANNLVANSSLGFFWVGGGVGNDIVDASGISNGTAISFIAGSGSDSFKGGNGNDSYVFASGDLTSADTVIGGAGLDTLFFLTAGGVAAGAFDNVSAIEALSLDAGGNAVALTNSLVAGTSLGYFRVSGASGSDTVDASAVTNGMPITILAGSGADTIIGGTSIGNYVFAAPDLTSADTVTGGLGVETIILATAGVVASSAFDNMSGLEGLVLNAGGNTVTLNNGVMAGTSTGFFWVSGGAGNDIVDASGVTSGVAISFIAGAGNDSFTGGNGNDGYVFASGDLTFADTVVGGLGYDTIFFATAGVIAAAAFTNVSGIESLVLDAGGNNVTLTNGLVAGTSTGVFRVGGGAGNDTVDASLVTNGTSVTFVAGSGTDKVVGGSSIGDYVFAAADLTSADTVQGGSGIETITFASAGTVAATAFANVTNLEGVVLNAGGNNVTLTDGAIAGTGIGYFWVSGGTGDDTVDASGVTNGVGMSFIAGSGSDSFKGGNGNDSYVFASGDLTSADTVIGGAGLDTLFFLTAGGVAAGAFANVSSLEGLVLDAGGNAVTLTDGLVAGTSIGFFRIAGYAGADTVDASGISNGISIAFLTGSGADTLTGGNGGDLFFIPDSAFAAINGNAGLDRIAPNTPAQSFDLTANASKITNTEIVDLNASVGASLNLAAADILQVNSTGKSLYVVGGADDLATIGFGWSLANLDVTNAAVEAGAHFTQFHNTTSNVDLFIDRDVRVAPVITSDGAGATATKSVNENTTAVTTVVATDPNPGTVLQYSIVPVGVGSPDSAKFTIDSSGILSFLSAPDFENPGSAASSNSYVVQVQVSDGTLATVQTITVNVTDANDPPVITSDGGGPSASKSVNENTTAVTQVTATDQDLPPQAFSYSIVGGADQLKFAIDGSGNLSFVSAPNFEAPTDVGADNGYVVQVRVTDNGAPNQNDTQTITVNVQNVNEAPDTAAVTANGNEDPVAPNYIPITVTGTDPDAGDSVAFFHITNLPTGAQGVLYTDTALTTAVVSGTDYAASGSALTLYFKPALNFNGPATFQAAAIDTHAVQDATAATETISVAAIDDAPVNTVPADNTLGTAMSNTDFVVSGISVSDVDANETAGGIIHTTLAVTNGTLAVTLAGGATISSGASGTSTLTLSGTQAQINQTLANNVIFHAADNITSPTTANLTVTTDDLGKTGSGGPLTDTDVIHIGVIPQVFVIDNTPAGAGNNGSLTDPFNSINSFNTLAADGTGDYIYLKAGTYSEADGINLLTNEHLFGEGQTLQFTNPVTGQIVTIGTGSGANTPIISVTGANQHGIDLASGNQVTGLNVATTLGNQIGIHDSGASVGSLSIADVDVTGAGKAVNIAHGGALAVAIDTLTSMASTTHGVQLGTNSGGTALTGLFSAGTGGNAASSSIAGAATAGFLVGDGAGNVNTGGTLSVDFGGAISAANAARTVDIQDHATGAVTLSGALTHTGSGVNGNGIFLDDNSSSFTFSGNSSNLSTGVANAVSISDQSGGTVAFSGTGLNIDTTTGTGVSLSGNNTGATFNFSGGSTTIDATGAAGGGFVSNAASGQGGTVNVTGSSNHISTTTGTALNFTNTTIGVSNVTFRDISSNGGSAAGIILINTGANGGLIVTGLDGGDADAFADAGTGGTIANKTGGNAWLFGGGTPTLNGVTDGVGIYMNNTKGASFSGMQLNDFTNAAISGFGSSNFTLNDSVVSGSNGNDTFQDEASLFFFNLTGTGAINRSTIGGGSEDNLYILNNTGTLNRFVVDGSTFNQNNSTTGNNSIHTVAQNGATLNFTLQNSTIKGARADWINSAAASGSTSDVDILNNTFSNLGANANAGAAPGGNRIVVSGIGTVTYDIENNNLSGSLGSAIFARATGDAGFHHGTLSGSIIGNTIGVQDTANSGSREASGIDVEADFEGRHTTLIQNNTIQQYNNHGILLLVGDMGNLGTTNVFNATVIGNTVRNPGNLNTDFNGLHTNFGTTSTGGPTGTVDTFAVGLDVHGNTFTSSGQGVNSPNNNDVRFRERQHVTVQLEGYAGANNDDAAVVTFIKGLNTGIATMTVQDNVAAGGGGYVGIGGVPTPLLAMSAGGVQAAEVPQWQLAGIGDFNGDGVADLLSLRADGLLRIDTLDGAGSSINWYIPGQLAAGWHMVGIGDINGDGTSDILLQNANGTFQAELIQNSALAATVDLEMVGGQLRVAMPSGADASASDPAVTPPPAEPATGAVETHLTQSELAGTVVAATARWEATGLTAAQTAILHNVAFTVEDLSGLYLGSADAGHVVIDSDGAGYGWYIDATPDDDAEFAHALSATRMQTDPSKLPAGHIDLLTAVMHEMGHQLGLEDTYADVDNLMYGYLVTGERRLPNAADATHAAPTGTTLVGDDGNDSLLGGTGSDYLDGGKGADLLMGGAGNDTVLGADGDDYVNGGDGNDVVFGGDSADILLGDADDDFLNGEHGNDIIFGHGGADTLIGDDGADYLSGGAGDDMLAGGSGNDTLFAGSGSDYLQGDAGDDTFVFDGAFESSIIIDLEVGTVAHHDAIQFTCGVFADFAALMAHAVQDATNTVITDSAGHTLTLANVVKTNLVSDDFVFA